MTTRITLTLTISPEKKKCPESAKPKQGKSNNITIINKK